MIQVHRELKNIQNHNFCGHPAVAPVIALHVFKTRVTNTAFDKLSDALKLIDQIVTNLQRKITTIGGGGIIRTYFTCATSKRILYIQGLSD